MSTMNRYLDCIKTKSNPSVALENKFLKYHYKQEKLFQSTFQELKQLTERLIKEDVHVGWIWQFSSALLIRLKFS